jgi:hypothetical protein
VFEVQGGFTWPLFPLTPAILCDMDPMLPIDQQARFKRYNPSIHTWSKVLVGHIITLKAGEHIFLKGYDVKNCQDFDRLLSASQQCKPHFAKNLSHERTYVRRALKEKKVWKAGNVLSSDDEEVEKDRSQASSKILIPRPLTLPHRFKVEPSDPALGLVVSDGDPTSHRTAALPRHVVKIEPTFIDLTMSDVEDAIPITIDDTLPSMDDAMPTPKKNKRPHSSSPSSTPCSSPNDTEESSDGGLPAWPAAFYVVDIVRGFEKCDKAHRERRSVEKAFFKCFKVPFWSTTFYNHRRNWDNASASSRDAALRAGHTPAGLWTTFLKHIYAKAAVDKKRKRVPN